MLVLSWEEVKVKDSCTSNLDRVCTNSQVEVVFGVVCVLSATRLVSVSNIKDWIPLMETPLKGVLYKNYDF